ncbi:MAG: DUF2249 domain-containing protein [Deltaproteobacteria bacterium]|nr:DUF2249 domain-containing protein [Deltaproteobacteria bacterium]
MQIYSSLKGMGTGDTLLIVNDNNPRLLLEQLRPIIDRNFTYWITEDGPQIWRIIFSRSESP